MRLLAIAATSLLTLSALALSAAALPAKVSIAGQTDIVGKKCNEVPEGGFQLDCEYEDCTSQPDSCHNDRCVIYFPAQGSPEDTCLITE